MVQLDPLEALELRLLEAAVTVAQAALSQAVQNRNARAIALASKHGADIARGSWHLDADAGTFAEVQPESAFFEEPVPPKPAGG